MNKVIPFIDLFAGCGGLSLGLEQAGFTPIFANEIWEPAATTYRLNRGLSESQVFVGDINYLVEHRADFNLPKCVDMVCGGPPCQGFSMANRQRVIDDPRNQLYKAYLRFLSQVRPRFFVMANVRGMATRIDEIVDNFRMALGDEYSFAYALLNAANFGVPQNRERFIFIGNRVGVNSQKVFDTLNEGKYPSFVLRDALEGLPELGHKTTKGASEEESDAVGYFKRPFQYAQNQYFRYINGRHKVKFLFKSIHAKHSNHVRRFIWKC